MTGDELTFIKGFNDLRKVRTPVASVFCDPNTIVFLNRFTPTFIPFFADLIITILNYKQKK